MRPFRSLFLLAPAALLPAQAWATATAEQVIESMDVDMSRISNIQSPGSQPDMFGVLSVAGTISPYNPPTMGVMSTGSVDSMFNLIDYDWPGSGMDTSAGDRATISFDLAAPQYANSFSFNFNFCSREYPEWVGSPYNDTFEVFLTSSAYNGQIVFDAFGNVVTVNNGLFTTTNWQDLVGTGFDNDGCTGWVTTIAPCDGGSTIHLEYTIYDVSDGVWDSSVFLDNLGFSEDEPPDGGPWTGDDTPEVPMEIAFLSPKEGDLSGGGQVTIYGEGFDNDVNVFWGTTPVSEDFVTVGVGGNELVISTIPDAEDAGVVAGGPVDIRLTRGVEELTLGAGYTYHAEGEGSAPPRMASMTPGVSHPDGGQSLSITGTGFVDGAQVFFDDVEAESVSVLPNGSEIATSAPAHEVGWVTVTVVNPDGQVTDPGYPFQFSEDAPVASDDDDDNGGGGGGCNVGGAGGSFLGLLLLGRLFRSSKGVR